MSEENDDGTPISDIIETVATGVPAPLRRNLLKAFGRLVSASIAVPIAKLEAYEREITENSKARAKLIKAQGDLLANNSEVPRQYLDRANEKFAQRIIQEQLNIDIISANAINDLKDFSNKSYAEKESEIDDDWLNEFEKYGRLKSSTEMRALFSKILSGEIKRPGTFSIKALRTVSQLDKSIATIFKKFCSFCICLCFREQVLDIRVPSPTSSKMKVLLLDYGISYTDVLNLIDYDLVRSNFDQVEDYGFCSYARELIKAPFYLKYCDQSFLLKMEEPYVKRAIPVYGFALTSIGRELYDLVDLHEDERYTKSHIGSLFKNDGAILLPINTYSNKQDE